MIAKKIALACLTLLLAGTPLAAAEIIWKKCQLNYKEKERGYDKKAGPFVILETSCPDFPRDVDVTAFAIKLDKSHEIIAETLHIDQSGVLRKGDAPFIFSLSKFAKGEPSQIVVVTKRPLKDGTMVAAELTMVPFPIEATTPQGHTLSLRLDSADGKAFRFYATGYAPNEWLTIVSRSGSDKLESAIQASEEGIIEGVVNPEANSLGTGRAVFEIVQANQDKVKINYDWGKAALRKYEGTVAERKGQSAIRIKTSAN